tara:strand:- start:643 stop:891 length:249 start_codon:yes stop_codon:yes gene_type:complete
MYLKDILLTDLTPDQLKEVEKGVKALIKYSENGPKMNNKQIQLQRLNRAEFMLNLPLTGPAETIENILNKIKQIKRTYNLIV